MIGEPPVAHVQDDMLALLSDAGLVPPTNDDDLREYLWESCQMLSRAVHGANVTRGVILEMVHERNLWQGKTTTWREYCEANGLSVFEASRLRTIVRWIAEQHIPLSDIVKVKDQMKLHALAVRAREMIEKTPDDEKPAVQEKITALVADAQHMSRVDVQRSMDVLGAAPIDPCNLYLTEKVCLRSGEKSPHGCSYCVEGWKG